MIFFRRATRRNPWLTLALVSVSQFVVVLDASIVYVALPAIGQSLQFTEGNLAWVVNAYTLTFGGFLLLGGRLGDLLGRRWMFIFGMTLFAGASLVGGFADSAAMLIAARAVQGLGAALASPAALAIVMTTFRDGTERNKALGVWGAVAGSGGAVGMLLGGVLTEYAGWQWVLWVNVPIGVVAAALAPLVIAESRAAAQTRAFDLAGALSVTAALAVLVYAIVEAPGAGWGSRQTVSLLGVAAGLLATFVVVERRSRAPLVPFAIFRLRTLAAANVIGLHLWAVMYAMIFFSTLYLQRVLGFSAFEAGLAYVPLTAVIVIAAGVASHLVTRIGFKPVIVAGLLLISAGTLWFSRIPQDGGYVADVLGPMLLCGLGLGLAYVPQTIAAVSGVAARDAGLASGLVTTSQQIGGALGLAMMSSVAYSTIGADEGPTLGTLTAGYADAFLLAGGVAVLGVAAAVLLISSSDSRAHVELARTAPAEAEVMGSPRPL